MILLSYILLLVGLFFLVLGGDWLVKGAVGIAEQFKISPLVIGLTVVAFGTSAPELVISLDAALSGVGELAVGNVVGSNIANVLLVLGLPALISPIACNEPGIKRTIFFLFGVTALFMYFLMTGRLERWHGAMLLVALLGYLAQQFHSAHQQKNDAAPDYKDELGKLPTSTAGIVTYLIMGLIALPIAAHLTVSSASAIAMHWGVSQAVIGLTIVAIGTSLPELATGVSAARQGNASVGVGNVIGSNIFNIAAIMGITASVIPVNVGMHIVEFDMWVMAGTTLLLIILPFFNFVIGKVTGSIAVCAYAIYVVSTFIT